jgi:hypothetical protein
VGAGGGLWGAAAPSGRTERRSGQATPTATSPPIGVEIDVMDVNLCIGGDERGAVDWRGARPALLRVHAARS